MSEPTTKVKVNPANLPKLRDYGSQWVVVQDGAVVAHGLKLEELVRAARALGIQHPFVHFVEPIRDGVARMGL